jgi:hypothetical protein
MKGKTGTPMNTEVSPAARKRRAKRQAAQERRWAARASEVVVRQAPDPYEKDRKESARLDR